MDTTPSPERPVRTPPSQRSVQIDQEDTIPFAACWMFHAFGPYHGKNFPDSVGGRVRFPYHGKNPADPEGGRLRTVPREDIKELN